MAGAYNKGVWEKNSSSDQHPNHYWFNKKRTTDNNDLGRLGKSGEKIYASVVSSLAPETSETSQDFLFKALWLEIKTL